MQVPPRDLRHPRWQDSTATILRKMVNCELQSGGTPTAAGYAAEARTGTNLAFDARGDPGLSVVCGFDTHDFAMAANMHIARGNDLLRQGQYKIDLASALKRSLRQEIQAAVADVSRMGLQFRAVCIVRHHPNGQGHDKAACFAPVRQISHYFPLE